MLSVYPLCSATAAAAAGLGIAVLSCPGSDTDPRLVALVALLRAATAEIAGAAPSS